MQTWTFDTVLVANRGEIALRILRSAKALGLKTAVVYHRADAQSPAVQLADQAIEITGSTPVAAYLDAAQVLAAARRCGKVAIHPGYGFLSENADFARACVAEGMVFVGPSPEAIDLMGDKVRARAFVEKHGFPVAPSAIEDDDPASFVQRASKLAFPLLIKPAAGGGGKGMRVVRDPEHLVSEIERARSEGLRYFGDGRLYVERYIENPRHIEVQVLGDTHGNLVHLYERECSVQRRFQKIVEETPSPALSESRRREICETAAGIARSAGYSNAGTVEFIYGAGGEFYFLEMNTRLQVEHPVTEQLLGVDLVAEQLRVASGSVLPFAQADLQPTGHAIEFRVYAEDAAAGYLPTTGPVLALREPSGEGVRVDTGIREGQDVTAAFDPMLAKLIITGADRSDALARADQALKDYVLLGCKTNLAFLRRLLHHPAFVAGEVHTGFLDANPDIAAEPVLPEQTLHKLLAAAALATRPIKDAADAVPPMHAAMGGWRN
ncbi:biotin carboxylase N-terminal domain-containing protein [Comamonas sp. A7-5]|uniref:acetyl-CoA carboxylase biotin carboxylase subunit n=1 Tax=Comamonas sp. A7-5 TaxID=673549 RepID=UPI0031DB1337